MQVVYEQLRSTLKGAPGIDIEIRFLNFNYLAAEPEVKREKKVKQRKTQLKLMPVYQYGALGQTLLNKYLEVECQLKSKDKEERDKSDARNNLEELVYAIRKVTQINLAGHNCTGGWL